MICVGQKASQHTTESIHEKNQKVKNLKNMQGATSGLMSSARKILTTLFTVKADARQNSLRNLLVKLLVLPRPTAYTTCKLLVPNGLQVYSFHGNLPVSASPMSCAVAEGVILSPIFKEHRTGTETRSDSNSHPGIFR